jgi:hypothetical protein
MSPNHEIKSFNVGQNRAFLIHKAVRLSIPDFSAHFKYVLIFVVGCLFQNIAHGQTARLFDSDDVLQLTLRTDLKKLLRDRGNDSQYHRATINYQEDGNNMDIPIRVKTRGNFRKKAGNCQYPPLLLNFAKSRTPNNSVFMGQDKLKLVTPCRGENYVIQEYLVYKLYNIITPKSFKARLVQMTLEDTLKAKSSAPLYGILLEEENQMAIRNLSESVNQIGLRPQDLPQNEFLKMAVFQFMIGNTDWSIQFQQNIKLINDGTNTYPIPVPYDFDHAGIVRAPYAKPTPELNMSSTLERRYRGYCMQDMNQFEPIFETFNALKDKFYKFYEDNPLLSSGYRKLTIKFLDEFFQTINNPKKASQAFLYPCGTSGTANVVIKGLKERK